MESLHILYVCWGFWLGKKVFCRELLPGGFFSAEIFYSTSYVTMMMIAFRFQLSINYILMQQCERIMTVTKFDVLKKVLD